MPKASILIVEDDGILALHLQESIARSGYAVVGPVPTGEEAVHMIRQNSVDLVLMDIELAGSMNGIVAAGVIADVVDVPVIFLTGFSQDPLIEQAKLVAPYGYLIKPVPEREMVATIEMALHRHALTIKLKQTQADLAESEARYRHRFEHSPVGVYQSSLDGRFLDMNTVMATMLGYESPKSAIEYFTDLATQLYVNPPDREKILTQLQEYGIVNNYEYQAKKKNGNPLWLSVTARINKYISSGETVIDGVVLDITERKSAENALQKNNNRLKSIVNIINNATISLEELLDNALSEAIKLTESEFGYIYHYNEDTQKFQLNTWSKEVMSECRIVEPQTCYELKKTGLWGEVVRQRTAIIVNDFEAEHPLKKGYPEGHAKLFKFMSVPVFDADRIVAVVGLANKPSDYCDSDVLQLRLLMNSVWKVVERRQANDALRRSEKHFRTLTENSPDFIMRYDRQCRHTYMNPAALRAAGLLPSQIIGKTHRECGFPEDLSAFWEKKILSVFATAQPCQEEFEWNSVYGPLHLDWRLTPELDDNGSVFSVLGVSRDITQIKRAEHEYRQLFTTLRSGFAVYEVVLDGEGRLYDYRFLNVNAAFEAFFDLKAETIIGKTMREEFPGTITSLIERFGEVAQNGKSIKFDYFFAAQNRHFAITAYSPLQGRLAALFADITERKHSEALLLEVNQELRAATRRAQQFAVQSEAANKAKSEFLANMSHEIRTPLNGIVGMLQLLELTESTPEQKEYIDQAKASSQRLAQLLSDILDISRIEAGKLVFENKPFTVEEVYKSIQSLLGLAATSKGLHLEFVTDASVPSLLFGDQIRLHQILFNLVGNAIKFTERGSVKVDAMRLPRSRKNTVRLLFVVSDTGIGIDDSILKELFQPFVQVESSYTRRFQGAGLGLSIVRRLVRLIGGTLAVDNAEKGTTFYVTLPYSVMQTESYGTDISQELPTHGHEQLRILVAEDDLTSQKALVRMLEKGGHKAEAVNNGQEVLERLRAVQFDVIFMDVQMPLMNGLEATKRIRSDASGEFDPHIPIIALTGYAMAGDREKFLAAGMNDYLSKPLVFNDVWEKLKQAERNINTNCNR